MAVLVGKQAPDFKASVVMEDGSVKSDLQFKEYVKGKMAVLFFYPLDFTFVCPTELRALEEQLDEFKKRNVEVMTVSVDSPYTHLAYKRTQLKDGGIGNVRFPMVSDLTRQIATDYDVLFNNSIAYRGTFLIDQQGVVRHQNINDLPLGRNISEILRVIDALQYHQQHGEVCPANWNKGDEAIKATQESVSKYLAKKAS